MGDRQGGPRGTVSGGGSLKTNGPVEAGASNEGAGTGEPTRPSGAFTPAAWPEGTNRPSVGSSRSAGGRTESKVGPDETTDQGLKVRAMTPEMNVPIHQSI